MIAIGGGGYVPARILRYFSQAANRDVVTNSVQLIPQAARRTKHSYPSHWSIVI